MAIIKINNKDYDFDTLSDEVKAQLVSLQATEVKLAELQRDIAITQTARNAYATVLNGLLEPKKKK